MAENKTKKTTISVTEFIAKNGETRRKDGEALLRIFKKAIGLKPVVWGNSTSGFVGYGLYHYKSERSTQEGDWPLTGFSPRKANLTVYIMAGLKAQKALLKKLGKHKVSGGSCVYINKLSDVDVPTLVKLIQAGVKEMKKRYPTAVLK